MNSRVLILDVTETSLTNKGAMASVLAAIKCLKSSIPNVEITAQSANVKVDKLYQDYGIKVRKHPWYKKSGGSKLSLLVSCATYILRDFLIISFSSVRYRLNKSIKSPYYQYGVVAILDTDSFNEQYYGSLVTLFHLVSIFLVQVLIRKPIIMGAASVGHFTNRFTKLLAKFLFNKVDVITVREEITLQYLNSLGINKPKVHLVPELAFILDPVPAEKVETILSMENILTSERPLIRLSPS